MLLLPSPLIPDAVGILPDIAVSLGVRCHRDRCGIGLWRSLAALPFAKNSRRRILFAKKEPPAHADRKKRANCGCRSQNRRSGSGYDGYRIYQDLSEETA